MKQAENIRARAVSQRAILNDEMSGVAQQLEGLVIGFAARAGETGKLYGSITVQMIADEISRRSGAQIDRRHIECEPIRTLGEHKCTVRLTVDLVPEVVIIVHREGEVPAALVPKPASSTEVASLDESNESAEESAE